MADVKQMKNVPLITREMSAIWCLVSMYLIWIWGSKLIRTNSQSRATLRVLDTCLIVGLLPLIIILITSELFPLFSPRVVLCLMTKSGLRQYREIQNDVLCTCLRNSSLELGSFCSHRQYVCPSFTYSKHNSHWIATPPFLVVSLSCFVFSICDLRRGRRGSDQC